MIDKKVQDLTTTPVAALQFRTGDEVVLALGAHPGTLGIFLGPTKDPKWAEITERDGQVRAHPLEWLEHAPPVNKVS